MQELYTTPEQQFLSLFPMSKTHASIKIRPLEEVARLTVKSVALESVKNQYFGVTDLTIGTDHHGKPTHISGVLNVGIDLLKRDGGAKEALLDLKGKLDKVIDGTFNKKKKDKKETQLLLTVTLTDSVMNILKPIYTSREVIDKLMSRNMFLDIEGNVMKITATRRG